ncbi:MAG: hypothetical protein M3O26_04985 [Pseudomonadota bacterium]|nr:hypothetical protein [Pseudomonadota bacterium]
MIAMRNSRLPAMIVTALCMVACSKHPPYGVPGEQAAIQPTIKAAAAQAVATVCDVVTAADMSKLLGSPVNAKPQRLASDCVYASAADGGPSAEIKIERGDGEAAMLGTTFANQFEPGLANPLTGLGDQAISAGPITMIRRGDDLILISVSGVEDSLAAVKRIYAAVDAKIQH